MSTKPPAFPELNLETLYRVLPTQYRQWLRVGIAAVLLGYSVTLVSLVVEGRVPSLWQVREPYVIAIAVIAGVLERRGQLRWAAMVLIFGVWIELHLTLVEQGARGIGTSAFCALVVGAALCLGRHEAVWISGAAMFTTPAATWLGFWLGTWRRSSGDIAALIILMTAIAGTGVLLHLFMDAFSRVLVEAERNRSRARELIDDAPDVVIALSDRGTVEDMNPAAERMLRLRRENAIGKPFSELPLTPATGDGAGPSRQASGELPREYVVQGSGETLEGLFRSVTRADGTAGLLVWLRDVTARNRAEAQAAALQDQLQHSQKLEALGRLAGGVAHDFNNLLTTVGGYADLIARHQDPKIRGVSLELSSIRERGKALTRQLLAFARKEKASPQAVDLSDALFAMEGLLAKLLLERVELEMQLEPDTTIFIDPGQLQQLMLNLVVNAKDAMPDGGSLHVSCRLASERERVELVIKDDGVGMDTTTKTRAFEPFFTTKPRGKGTGLGLSMVHGIVEASHGTIELRSEPGEGTTVTVSWPWHRTTERSSRPTLPPVPRSRRRGTLMVVEDDPEGLTVLTNLLQEAGYRVITAKDGAQALQSVTALLASGESPDLVLSDVRMPTLSGPELALELRGLVPGLPVLFVSGYYEADLEGAVLTKDMDVLAKPFTTSELLSRIERAMSHRYEPEARRA